MHDDDEPVASTVQDAWVAIVTELREQLKRRIAGVGEMSPSDIKAFIDCFVDLRWLEVGAMTFDGDVDRRGRSFD